MVKVGRDAKLAGGLGNGSADSLADGSAGGTGGALGLAPTRTRAKMWTLMVNHANFADFVVTPSEHFGRKLEHYGVSKPITVISNGISDEMVAQFDRGWTADGAPTVGVREMGEGETLRLFWNSRVSKEKRLLPILEALALVKRPFELAVYGNGNQLRKAKRVARRLGLMGKSRVTGGSAGNGEPVAVKKVEFFGRVEYETLLEKMRDEHLAVVGSFGFDTQSMALLEAEATGLPVLFIDPDMAEVVPAEGAVNVPLELNKKAARELWAAPTAEEIAGVIDGIKAEDIEKMSRAMYENRGEVLESRQLTKILALYKEAVVGVD